MKAQLRVRFRPRSLPRKDSYRENIRVLRRRAFVVHGAPFVGEGIGVQAVAPQALACARLLLLIRAPCLARDDGRCECVCLLARQRTFSRGPI